MRPPVLSQGGYVVIPEPDRATLGWVPISSIRLPDNHSEMDARHVLALMAILRSGGALPPVLLVLDDGLGLWLVEGRHRYLATVLLGRSEVFAITADRIEVRRA